MSYEKSRHVTGIGQYDDYDAVKEAKLEYYRHPEKYTRDKTYYSTRSSNNYDTTYRKRSNERVHVVIEHWTGCTGERRAEAIKDLLDDYYPDVKCTDFYGRYDSFEVFINGKILYSRIMQGGYPYDDEVLDGVWRAKHGKKIYQIEREGGSEMCNIL